MAFIAEERRKKFWFGTENRAEFFPTPNRGADVSPTGWGAGGTLLNGGGYQLNSFGSHKNYIFEWPESSAREVAQKMKSYADGTYGRGLIYFIDPLTWTTNMLPAQWADPSMALGYEGTSLVYGVDPVSVPTSGWESNDLPVNSAYYDLAGVATGWRGKEEAVFIPIPEGYTLSLGSFHSQSGTGRVYYREQATNGALGAIVALTPLANNSSQVVNTFVSGANLAGVWLYVGKSGAGAGSVTLTAMIGRLIPSVKTQSTMVAQNLFTNPNLVGDGTYAEVRRNRAIMPRATSAVGGWSMTFGTGGAGEQTFHGSWGSIAQPVSRGTVTVVPTSGAIRMQVTLIGSDIPVTPGETIRILIRVGCDVPVRLTADWRLGSTYVSAITTPYETRDYGEAGWVEWETIVPAGVDNMRLFVQPHPSQIDVGTRLVTGALMIGHGDYFDGSTADRTVDPDMRQRWLGAPNASESVMEIEQVAGLTATNCVAGVSTRAGKPAVRLIPTGASNLSYAWSAIPVEARASGTALGTLYLDEPLTGSLNTDALSIRVHTPTQRESAPNTAGEYPLRLGFSGITSGNTLRLYHGGSIGSGDVWWTDIGLFAGEYDGPAFSGDSSGVVINGRNVRTQWDGAPDNSTSSAWTMTPEFDRLKEGPWIGGQGHSGCRFVGKPTYVNNTGVDGGQVSFAASFREVGLWVNG